MTTPWAAPDPAPEPSPRSVVRRSGRRGLVPLALIDALALTAGIAAYALHSPAAAPPPRAAASTAPRDIRSLVPELTRFVEAERGLRFRSPVQVELLDDAASRARLAGEDEPATAPAEPEPDVAVTLQALGLIDPGVDLDAAVDELTGDTVAGFYDAEADELVIRGDEATPLVRTVLVHELTHALQDQHFDLHRPQLRERDDEAHLGFLGLVEGDASLVEEAYRAQLSRAERRSVAEEEEALYGDAAADAPLVLTALLGFPYGAGPAFVRELREERGQAGVDAVFRRPPTSSEHLIHVEAYLAGDDPVPVATPRARGAVVDRGVLGELGLLLTLTLASGADDAAALRSVDDWGGDRYVSWREGSVACTAVTVVMDDAAAAEELRSALRRVVTERRGAATAGSGTRVTFEACA